MNSVKTKAGTELPLLDLKGKNYLAVQWRLVWFREEKPNWTIETETVILEPTSAVFKATVKDETGRVISQGHKSETKTGFPDFIEKAETGAIGRALANCGYGTAFAADLEEGDRIADAPIAPRQAPVNSARTVVTNVTHNQTNSTGYGQNAQANGVKKLL